MAKTNSSRHSRTLILARRRLVARLLLRGMTQREIMDGLTASGSVNPDNGTPWSLGTVNSDVKALAREWASSAAGDVDAQRGRLLAELREVKRQAWTAQHPNLKAVMEAIKQERGILGVDAPQKLEVDIPPGGGVLVYVPDNGRDPDLRLTEPHKQLPAPAETSD